MTEFQEEVIERISANGVDESLNHAAAEFMRSSFSPKYCLI